MHNFEISESLTKKLGKLLKKDKKRYGAVMRKIEEIVSCKDISHYKNLRYDMSDSKRVHIAKSFVLVFRYSKKENKIYFDDLGHHDEVY